MKVTDSISIRGTAAAQRPAAARPAARPASSASAVRPVSDTTEVMGIPESEFTPRVREAIMKLMAEVDTLRRELQASSKRIESLEKLADTDPLTPVPNRRAFVRELSRMMSFSERYSTPASVVYFDLDGLKQINDAHGHAAGDAAIVHVAATLSANVRDSDFVGRLGGDEFGVILPYTDQPTATVKGATLAQAVAESPLDWKGQAIALSVSYGAQAVTPGMDAAGALDAADRAMYVQKRRSQAG
jgi:diguanylate cyclase (GGDEF)-like protein